jgi:hypothetical protein
MVPAGRDLRHGENIPGKVAWGFLARPGKLDIIIHCIVKNYMVQPGSSGTWPGVWELPLPPCCAGLQDGDPFRSVFLFFGYF